MENIYAISSGATKAGVCVIRISGPEAEKSLQVLTNKPLPQHRMASVRYLYDNEELLDDALVIYFESPKSFTGENVVELHIHGGRAIIDGVLKALSKINNFRMAEPGEFSRRAFENGKMDLTKAEAIADLIDAETKAQKKQALRQMEGELGRLYEGWRKDLKEIMAYTEAVIDFSDEEIDVDNTSPKIKRVLQEIDNHLNDNGRGEKLREGLSIAILGAPNAGKSQLMNAIAKREVAIVSDTAGTTRDVIDVHLDLNGYPAIISDTAGIREADNEIEHEGILRALKKAENADIKVVMFDCSKDVDDTSLDLIDEDSIVVINKCDLEKKENSYKAVCAKASDVIEISALKGMNLDVLLSKLEQETESRLFSAGSASVTRERHRKFLQNAVESLNRAIENNVLELQAEDVRLAIREIGKITGSVEIEELLDIIFSDFCIGK
ncbi:MAG: tRNA uridine-5-carboxymethylaminomethyl(34) synthesis GTPase MnmE [Alphaproteobacteria bacterium]|jgi:tRNA modification GTPase|nr:tRNA uridine-5-carboxymethylaminomethyl(34) synthesis GTPase MnmE [Alphaproteobacteria bacterium]